MASALERFRAAERAPLISSAERSRNANFARSVAERRESGNNLTNLTTSDNRAPDPGPQGSTAGVASSTFQYPATLPPLSPQMQRQFMERRRMAQRQYEASAAQIERQRQMAEAAAVQQRRLIGREQAEQSRQGMTSLASRGVARSPIFVNPFQRQVAQVAQQRVGELEMGLGQTLENLRAALQQADIDRQRELQQIEFDIAQERSNLGALLGVG